MRIQFRNWTAAVASIAALTAPMMVSATEITGAGATFPAPIYSKWAEAYKAATGVQMNYQAVGSGGGVNQIKAKTVDFGASDDPMSGEDLTKNGLLQFPAVIGGVVAVVNLPGIQPGQLKIDGKVLADIFRGKITKWNDPAITAMNAGVTLSDTAITLVYRSDSSGTTAVFTDYLAGVSPEFKKDVGAGKTVTWASGVGGRGNAGVAASVTKVAGSIGYVEYAYAKQNKMIHMGMVNKAGKLVQPDDLTFAASAAKADWKSAPGFGANLNNSGEPNAWPMTSASFILMHKAAEKADRSAESLKFFQWAYKNGQKLAIDLDYVPIPAPVVSQIEATFAEIKDAAGKPVLAK
jgi:phosphate transport system substrate-binding protein